jgi:hypothetical protein
MAEQNKLEAFSDHPTPPNDPHHAIDLPNSIFVVSAPPPTHGYPHNHQVFPGIVLSFSLFFIFV